MENLIGPATVVAIIAVVLRITWKAAYQSGREAGWKYGFIHGNIYGLESNPDKIRIPKRFNPLWEIWTMGESNWNINEDIEAAIKDEEGRQY